MLRVFVITSEKYYWCLRPFSHLFNTFWSSLQPVIVAGFSPPSYVLPSNFEFFSIDRENYPPGRWSDGLIKFLQAMPDEHFALFLEDYWLVRTVDARGIIACYEYIRERPEVLRIDLTGDRLYAGGMFDADYWGCYDIIETPYNTPYQMSTQAAIWNKARLLELLEPNKSAWEVEIQTQPPETMRVLGTRQSPVRYANAILKGKLDLLQLALLPSEHKNHIFSMIPKEVIDSR